MDVRSYLPSKQFGLLALSLIASIGLVYGAERLAAPKKASGTLELDQQAQAEAEKEWQQSLQAIQNITPPSYGAVDATAQEILDGSKTANLTENIGKTVFIHTSAATGQGLGEDPDTQNQILSAALAQINQTTTVVPYTSDDITTEPNSAANLHTYGNAIATAIANHPDASFNTVIAAFGLAIDGNDATYLKEMPRASKDLKALARDIIRIPVPQQFAAYSVQAANNYLHMAEACDNMQAALGDPVRALAGLQILNQAADSNKNVFTQIANALQNNGILFDKSEAGSAWSAFLVQIQVEAQTPSQPPQQ